MFLKSALHFLSLTFLVLCCTSKVERSTKILTWEYKRQDSPPYREGNFLCAYEKTDTGFVKTELLFSEIFEPNVADPSEPIYQGRYLISSGGDIIDLETGEVLFIGIANDVLDVIQGDSVYFRHIPLDGRLESEMDTLRHRKIKSSAYLYNLQTRQIEALDTGRELDTLQKPLGHLRGIIGVKSPQRKYQADFVLGSKDDDFWFVEDPDFIPCGYTRMFPNRGTIVVTETGTQKKVFEHSAIFNFGLRDWADLPLHWLDDQRLLTQENNGQLILVDILTQSIERFPPLDSVIHCARVPHFETDGLGVLHYFCSTEKGFRFMVDLENLSLSPVDTWSLSADFQRKVGHNGYAQYLRQGQAITSDTLQTYNSDISEDQLAYQVLDLRPEEAIPGQNRYDYWNWIFWVDGETGSIDTIEIPYLRQFVGFY